MPKKLFRPPAGDGRHLRQESRALRGRGLPQRHAAGRLLHAGGAGGRASTSAACRASTTPRSTPSSSPTAASSPTSCATSATAIPSKVMPQAGLAWTSTRPARCSSPGAKETAMLRVVRTLALVTVLIGAPLGAAAQSPQEANKKIVVEFYDKAINQKDFEAASKFLGPRYTQHNPNAADGPEGLKAFLRLPPREVPQLQEARSSGSSPRATTSSCTSTRSASPASAAAPSSTSSSWRTARSWSIGMSCSRFRRRRRTRTACSRASSHAWRRGAGGPRGRRRGSRLPRGGRPPRNGLGWAPPRAGRTVAVGGNGSRRPPPHPRAARPPRGGNT